MLTLIVFFPPSQFLAHSPDLDQTVIDIYCKLQNTFKHAQHASSMCFIGKVQNFHKKKKAFKERSLQQVV